MSSCRDVKRDGKGTVRERGAYTSIDCTCLNNACRLVLLFLGTLRLTDGRFVVKEIIIRFIQFLISRTARTMYKYYKIIYIHWSASLLSSLSAFQLNSFRVNQL